MARCHLLLVGSVALSLFGPGCAIRSRDPNSSLAGVPEPQVEERIDKRKHRELESPTYKRPEDDSAQYDQSGNPLTPPPKVLPREDGDDPPVGDRSVDKGAPTLPPGTVVAAPEPIPEPPPEPPPPIQPPVEVAPEASPEPAPVEYAAAEPPPPKYEMVAPRPGFVWLEGRWQLSGGRWTWVPGQWVPERAGALWRPGRWDQQGSRFVFIPGLWLAIEAPAPDRGPTSPPPQPRYSRPAPRPGWVWLEGNWAWTPRGWQWVPGRWDRPRPGQRWQPGMWERRDQRYAFTPGTWVFDQTTQHGMPGGPAGPPPPPRYVSPGVRPGFVWTQGRWAWVNGRWDWVGGHWEPVRPGRRWQDGGWRQEGERFVYIPGLWLAIGE